MASTPSKIPTKGRPVRESKLTPVSRDPRRDVSGKRRSELVSPKIEARKTRTPPSSASSGTPGSSRQPALPATSVPSLVAKAKSVNVQGDYSVSALSVTADKG